MGNESFKEIDNIIEKEFDEIINLSKQDTKVNTWYDSGVYALNYTCSKNLFGAYPKGRVIGMDGLSGVGKSLLAATMMRDPKIDIIFIIESEGGGNAEELLEFASVDKNKVRKIFCSTFNSYKISKKNGKIEEISDEKLPKNKETSDYVYKEGLGSIIRRLSYMFQFNKKLKDINAVFILDSLGNMQSVRGISGCWHPETLVATINENNVCYKKIKEVQKGEMVLTHLGTSEEVLKKFEFDDKKELIEIEAENGCIYKLTPSHKMLVERDGETQWVEAQNLTLTDSLLKIEVVKNG